MGRQKHIFLLRANYDLEPRFDAYEVVEWPIAYEQVDDYEVVKAIDPSGGEALRKATDALAYMDLRRRFNNDIRGPYIVTLDAGGEFELTDTWATVFWGKPPRGYDLTDTDLFNEQKGD